ncbi:hypothetical protein O53_217 [Microcystis aeruginosa TAIHU98]|uniref:Uncharacterized protein n=1 Tax=Microcystis aeruginosa TAIHU98 TaxID=1134457 RepID=L7E844_MICAE|nr:hypothetical protein O53_217 [Microcystis aeruginosa TAIHU98]
MDFRFDPPLPPLDKGGCRSPLNPPLNKGGADPPLIPP